MQNLDYNNRGGIMKFKTGDKVKIRKDSEFCGQSKSHNPSNEIGTVSYEGDFFKTNLTDEYDTGVIWKGGNNVYRKYDLEHCRIKNTKIARKLYPHYKENGEWLEVR